VAAAAYVVLSRLILAGLPLLWDGVVSFAVAGWLGVFAYVAVTRRPTAPLPGGTAAERSEVAPGEVYEVRFGFVRRDLLLPVSMAFVAVGNLMLRDEPVPAVGVTTFGGAVLLLRLVSALSRRVALRVDATGVVTARRRDLGSRMSACDGAEPGNGGRPGSQMLVPHVPPDVLADSRPATFWRLHRPSLEVAVRHFAPAVEIVDLG
jgi:hypothetical protein